MPSLMEHPSDQLNKSAKDHSNFSPNSNCTRNRIFLPTTENGSSDLRRVSMMGYHSSDIEVEIEPEDYAYDCTKQHSDK